MKTPEQIYISTLAERITSHSNQATQELNALEDEYAVILSSLDLQWRQTVQDLFTSLRTHLEGIAQQTSLMKGERK